MYDFILLLVYLLPFPALIHSIAIRSYPTLSTSIFSAYIVHYLQCPLNYYFVLHVYFDVICILSGAMGVYGSCIIEDYC